MEVWDNQFQQTYFYAMHTLIKVLQDIVWYNPLQTFSELVNPTTIKSGFGKLRTVTSHESQQPLQNNRK